MKERFRIWKRLQEKLPGSWKARYVPGLDRISWYQFLSFYFVRADREDIRMRASYMAFNFLLAIFPAIIFFFTLIAYLPFEEAHEDLLELIRRLMPRNAYESLSETMEDILSKQRSGLLSVGFLAAVYFSTSAIDSMIRSFHRSLRIMDKRPFIKKKLYNILLNVYFSLLLLLALLMITLGDAAFAWLRGHDFVGKTLITYFGQTLNWILVVLLIQLVVSSLYRFGPFNRSHWPFINPGSVATTMLIILMSFGLSFYVNQFNAYNKIYGSIGTLVVIMLWIFWNSVVTLIGFEFNIFLDQVKERRAQARDLEEKRKGNQMIEE